MTVQPLTVSAVDQPLVVELSDRVLQQTAPQELLLLQETSGEYFEDPRAVLFGEGRDEPLGFGVDLQMLTPYVLAVASVAVQFLVSLASDTVKDVAKDGVKPHVQALVRRLFRGHPEPAEPASPLHLDTDQSRRLWQIAHDQGVAVGLDAGHATLLADAVLGSLTVAG